MAVNTCVSIIPSSCNEKFLAGAEERLGVGGGRELLLIHSVTSSKTDLKVILYKKEKERKGKMRSGGEGQRREGESGKLICSRAGGLQNFASSGGIFHDGHLGLLFLPPSHLTSSTVNSF